MTNYANYDNLQCEIIKIASYLQESRNIIEASKTNHITELGNELLDNLNSLIREIDLTVMGVESRQANNIKDFITTRSCLSSNLSVSSAPDILRSYQ